MRKNLENHNSYERQNIVGYYVPDDVLNELDLDLDLPDGYCLIGGAARSAAFAVLHPDQTPPPIRDLDVAYLSE